MIHMVVVRASRGGVRWYICSQIQMRWPLEMMYLGIEGEMSVRRVSGVHAYQEWITPGIHPKHQRRMLMQKSAEGICQVDPMTSQIGICVPAPRPRSGGEA